jgi:hypothetical protein
MAAGAHTFYPPRYYVVQFIVKVLAVSSILPLIVLIYLALNDLITALSLLILLGGTAVYLVMAAILAFVIYTQFLRPRVTLSPAGIEYHHRRLHLRAPWELAEAIGDRRTAPKAPVLEGLILRDVTPQPEGAKQTDPYDIAPTRFIPLELFSPNWRQTQLGQELMYYAPVLFPLERQ